MPKVLVIEDSPSQALALEHLLKEQGLKVNIAGDGAAGIEIARQWMPDVIILDLEMPGMDGFEVCEHLQANAETSHIPIIMLTIHNSPPAVRRSMTLGAVDFVPKDNLTDAVLLETLRQMQILSEILPSAEE